MSNVTVTTGSGWIAILIFYIMFVGDPDLYDMIMLVLQSMAAQ